MGYDQGRLWVKVISTQALRQYMEYRGESNRSLAAKCGPGVGRSIISHLRSGARTSCSPRTAAAIAEALDVPVRALFVDEVTTASPLTKRGAA